jgi:hypothetical protein
LNNIDWNDNYKKTEKKKKKKEWRKKKIRKE